MFLYILYNSTDENSFSLRPRQLKFVRKAGETVTEAKKDADLSPSPDYARNI